MASLTSFGAKEPLPTQRRKAITFRYGRCSVDEDSFLNEGPLLQPELPQKVEHAYHKDATNFAYCDSWEIEVCVGVAFKKIIEPRWDEMKNLGRLLVILKVHKEPPVCELFFMPREQVVATYGSKMPKNVEWVHLYDPDREFAFWAELYKPGDKAGRGKSFLTDEFCGAFGSRYCLAGDLKAQMKTAEGEGADAKKAADALNLLCNAVPREQTVEEAAKAKAKVEKNKRKKAKQKEKKKQAKAEEAERKKAEEDAEEEARLLAVRAAKIQISVPLDMSAMQRKAGGGGGGGGCGGGGGAAAAES